MDPRRLVCSPSGRVVVFSCVLTALGIALFLSGVKDVPAVAAPFHLPWWALAIGFGGAEVLVMHLQFRRETHSLSLSEVPVVLGLVFATPSALVAGYLVGAGLALVLHRRQPLMKLFFNLSQFLVAGCVGAVVFHAALPLQVGIGPGLWLATATASLAADLVAVVCVSLVISAHQGRFQSRQVSDVFTAGMVLGVVNTSLALVAVTVLWVDPRSVWMLGVVAGVVVFAYRGYGSLRERHASLELLYEFTRAVGRSPRAEEVMEAVLMQARELLRADIAELLFFSPEGTDEPVHHVRLVGQDVEIVDPPEPVDEVLAAMAAENKTLVLPRSTKNPRFRQHLADRGVSDCVIAPLRGESGVVGAITVCNRLGDVSTFGENDGRLFETIANHASVALENGRLVERLRHEALHDSLTGLPNRTLFHDRVERALRRRRVAGGGVAVMLMDLDRFKEINDSLGHHSGDLVLQEVGRRLSSMMIPNMSIARLGGDEFAVAVTGTSTSEEVGLLAERIRDELSAGMSHNGVDLEIGATIGISLASDNGEDSSTLLRRADIAMYSAKGSQEGVAWYSPELDENSPRRLALVGELRHAIASGGLRVYYQPKASLATRRVVGVEALVRWIHPEEGVIGPDAFIPVAERTGLIVPLTTFVLKEALAQCRRWQDAGIHLPVAVNLSARSLIDSELPSRVAAALAEARLAPDMLTLEVTESSVMFDPDRTIAVLVALREVGVGISVDDFGTGYSSLAYLQRLPVNEVKVDKSFVFNLTRHSNDAAIVRSIVDLGRNLGLRVVAEGVEDEETWNHLALLGCDQAQGYLISRPAPPEELTHLLGIEVVARREVQRFSFAKVATREAVGN